MGSLGELTGSGASLEVLSVRGKDVGATGDVDGPEPSPLAVPPEGRGGTPKHFGEFLEGHRTRRGQRSRFHSSKQ